MLPAIAAGHDRIAGAGQQAAELVGLVVERGVLLTAGTSKYRNYAGWAHSSFVLADQSSHASGRCVHRLLLTISQPVPPSLAPPTRCTR